jgi:hypothetical protein
VSYDLRVDYSGLGDIDYKKKIKHKIYMKIQLGSIDEERKQVLPLQTIIGDMII